MKDISIPIDIKKHVKRLIIKKITVWLAFTAVLFILILFFGERCFGRLGNSKYGLYAVLLLIPIFTTRGYKLLFDHSFVGKIEKIDIKYSTDSDRSFKPSLETLYTKETVYFHIKTNEGKVVEHKAFENRANPHNSSKLYRVGDTVVHIYGTRFIQIISDDSESIICTVCGTANPSSENKCISCGKTLKIDIK